MSSIRSPTQDLSPRNPKSQPVFSSLFRAERRPPQASGIISRHPGIGYREFFDLNGHAPARGYAYRSGANVAVQPEFLLQFADMGVAYMRAMYGLENPRVGLLNNGTESHKGTPTETEAYQLLSAQENIRFVGNVEANAIAFDACDVLVTDGFTGNILLKSIEGVGKLVMKRMKGIFYASSLTKLAALTVKKPFMQFKRDFDVTEHGGSPILGLRKPVIKAHGSSNAKAFKNAIRQAMRFAESGAIDRMADMLAAPPADEAGARGENQT